MTDATVPEFKVNQATGCYGIAGLPLFWYDNILSYKETDLATAMSAKRYEELLAFMRGKGIGTFRGHDYIRKTEVERFLLNG